MATLYADIAAAQVAAEASSLVKYTGENTDYGYLVINGVNKAILDFLPPPYDGNNPFRPSLTTLSAAEMPYYDTGTSTAMVQSDAKLWGVTEAGESYGVSWYDDVLDAWVKISEDVQVDQTYNPAGTGATSNVAVAEALDTVRIGARVLNWSSNENGYFEHPKLNNFVVPGFAATDFIEYDTPIAAVDTTYRDILLNDPDESKQDGVFLTSIQTQQAANSASIGTIETTLADYLTLGQNNSTANKASLLLDIQADMMAAVTSDVLEYEVILNYSNDSYHQYMTNKYTAMFRGIVFTGMSNDWVVQIRGAVSFDGSDYEYYSNDYIDTTGLSATTYQGVGSQYISSAVGIGPQISGLIKNKLYVSIIAKGTALSAMSGTLECDYLLVSR